MVGTAERECSAMRARGRGECAEARAHLLAARVARAAAGARAAAAAAAARAALAGALKGAVALMWTVAVVVLFCGRGLASKGKGNKVAHGGGRLCSRVQRGARSSGA